MRYHFKIRKESTGYSAECVELKGCRTQGDTREELEANMSEALDLFLSEPTDSPLEFPLPSRLTKPSKNVAVVQVSARVAFAVMLKRLRMRSHLTQAQAAKRLGIAKNLWSYQKLESPKSANPTLETIEKVKKAFPEFDLDQVV